MSKLILQLPDGEERLVPLRKDETFTVGRDPRHDIAVDDRTVSRLHARLTWRGDGVCLLEDLQSANGTMLNDVAVVRPEPLQDGDRLSFGRVTAIYLSPDAARPPARESAVGDLFAARYRLERSLGETDEYETFRAADIAAEGTPVAVTIFLLPAIARAGGFDGVRRQYAGVRAAPHPGLVRALEFARWRGSEYLVTEWIEGCNLLDLLRRRGALTLPGALRLIEQVAPVTDHARAHGLPTPDLAPRAVLLSLGQQVLDSPVERWPAFAVRIIPRLFAPAVAGPWPLGTLLCDLLGHPPTRPGLPPSSRIACLGEEGNRVLAQGFAAKHEASGSDAGFVADLAKAVGLSAPKR